MIDPETDLDFSEYEAMATDVAASTHVLPRAIVIVAVGGGAAAVTAYRSVWGDEPAVWPTVAYNNVGDTTLTWVAGGYPDLNTTPARRVTRAPAFIACQIQSVKAGFNDPTLTSNTLRVETFDELFAADSQQYTAFLY
ncbi:MAG: hypothetical protein WC563_15775 [Brevundimonas sp.]